MRNKNVQRAFIIGGSLLGILIAFILKPPAALVESATEAGATGRQAMIVLGTVVAGIFWWISAVVPDWVVSVGMLCVWIITKTCTFGLAFSQFREETIWLLFGAFCVAGCVVKTGALRRISLNLMKIFRPTFKGQVLSLLTVGTVISPLLPSATAKSVLGVNMAVSSGNAMKYQNNSKGATGLFVASWTGTALVAPLFLSASAFSYVVLSATKSSISWLRWLAAMLPWAVIVLVGMFFVIVRIYKPQSEEGISKDYVTSELKAMGKMSRGEITSLIILFACLICWILEKQIGVSAATVAMVGGLVCFGVGLLKPKELESTAPWALMVFTASVIQMGNMFGIVGLSGWLRVLLTPVFSHISNVYILVVVIVVLAYLVRFAIASQAAVITLFVLILSPIVSTTGISALALGLVVLTAMPMWFVPYQNTTYAAAFGAAKGYVRHGDVAKSCIAYCVISLIGCLVSIPYWQLIGLVG